MPRSMIVTAVPRVSFFEIGAVGAPVVRQLSTSGPTKDGSARDVPVANEELSGSEILSAEHIDTTPVSSTANRANMMQPPLPGDDTPLGVEAPDSDSE
jgi:hypothetical protein